MTDTAPPTTPSTPAAIESRQGAVAVRSQWQVFRRKFLRHRLAMVSVVVLTVLVLASVFAEQVAPYDPLLPDILNNRQPPSAEHFFGTDLLGRDHFTRVLYGMRTSLYVALFVAVLSTAVGTMVGAIAGYYRGWVDAVLMRFVDLILVLPGLAVLLVASALLGLNSPNQIALLLAALAWVPLSRIVRGAFLSLREKEFVEAARAGGSGPARIMFRQILPNAIGPILVNFTLTIATAILIEATLSFLGLGLSPPRPALGLLINDGRDYMISNWWLVTTPGLTIVLICLCIYFIGDGLRDALDPTQQES